MSNTKGRTNGHYSLADFRKEATGEPFVLDVDTDHAITVERPTVDQMFDAEEAMRAGGSRDVLKALCGDATDDFLKTLGTEDAAVLKQVTDAMAKHFGLGE